MTSRSTWILLLPFGALALVLALAWQAVETAVEHRRAAEAVLRDYAELAAQELVRRGINEVGYYGFFPLIRRLSEGFGDPAVPLSTAIPGVEPEDRTVKTELIRRVFRRVDAGLELSPPDAELAPWLATRLAAEPDADAPFRVLHGLVGGEQRLIVHTSVEGASLGFEVDRRGLADRLRSAFERGPLLPASLGLPGAEREPLEARIHDPSGELLVRLGEELPPPDDPYARQLSMEVPFGDAYQGVLAGHSAAVTLDPRAAGDLVIGGLPASRLPILAALAALAVGFLVATAVVARREQRTARLRADFIARVSHELRTPLTQIRIFAETLLLDRLRHPAERRRALTILDRESRRLSHLVENLLHFSRGERRLRIHPTRQPIAPLLERIVERIEPMLVDQTLEVENRLAAGLELDVDGDALQQVLLNLVDNASKYGPPDQELRLRWQRLGEHVRLSVTDQGPGVPAAERHRIWGDFERLERAAEQAVPGTGIGLSVVRELAEAHGGRAWVDDGGEPGSADGEEVRGGARFGIDLPLPRPEGASR
ncbi:MAG: HAMP domain-containing histidine kinase [Holophagales bacterium]|nr:HAMP domain-containing histidine kinase [Holophagales bacterium]